ncbi:MAG: hypothetical protein ABIB12_01145, partial [Patescibacteria group bacterium]
MARSYRKPRRVRKKKQRNWKRILVLLLFGLVLGAVLYTAFFSEFVQVRGVRLEGVENVDREALQERVVSLLEQRVLFWGTRSIFLLAPERVEQEVEQAFPCIASATADRLFWQRAFVLRVEERREEAVWCMGTECFSVDKEGVVFQKSSPDTAILLIFSEEKTGKLGERIVEPGLLN